jgi:hypothetical protein
MSRSMRQDRAAPVNAYAAACSCGREAALDTVSAFCHYSE